MNEPVVSSLSPECECAKTTVKKESRRYHDSKPRLTHGPKSAGKIQERQEAGCASWQKDGACHKIILIIIVKYFRFKSKNKKL